MSTLKQSGYIKIIDKRFKKYEDALLHFFNIIGEQKRTNPKIITLIGYLYIYQGLTQKQFKKLTGYSLGTISTYLSALLSMQAIEKKLIPGTHKYIYSSRLKMDIKTMTEESLKIFLGSFQSAMEYVKELEPVLKAFDTSESKHLLQRLNAIEEIFNLYQYIFGLSEDSLPINHQTILNKKLEFGPELINIEDNIIDFIVKLPMFSGKDLFFMKIFGYFLTRGILTQKDLRRLTNFSKGMISQEINKMLEIELIEVHEITKTGEIKYISRSIVLTLLNFTKNIIKAMIFEEKKLITLKKELENNRSTLGEVYGFTQIYQIFDFFINLIEFYKEMMDKVGLVLEKIKKN